MLGDVQLIEENGSIYAECDNAAGRLYEGLQAMMLTMLMKPPLNPLAPRYRRIRRPAVHVYARVSCGIARRLRLALI